MQINFPAFLKSEKFNKIFNTSLLLVFVVLTFLTMINHELWRDEAQAWLVVRDLNPLGIIDHVKTEGHPLLWYAVLFPFAKLHFPVFSMQVVSFLLSVCGACVFLFCSPFNKFTKTAVIFSSGFLYWYSVISRSYSLIPPLIFLLAVFYRVRLKHPYIYTSLLILLSNTHVLMFGFCAAAALCFAFELLSCKEKTIPPLILLCINFFCVITYLAAGRSENELVQSYSEIATGDLSLYKTALSLFINIFANISFLMLACLVVAAVVLFVRIFKSDKKVFWLVFTGIAFQILVYRYIWSTSPEKAFLTLLILLFGYWAAESLKNVLTKNKFLFEIILAFVFLMTWHVSFDVVKNDIQYNYSGSKDAAKYIKNNLARDAVLVSSYNVTTAGISAYLPDEKFYFPQEKNFYTFSKWNKGIMTPYIDYSDFEKLPQVFKNKKLYFVFSYITSPDELASVLPKNLKKVYESPSDTLLASEKFYIYELKNDE